MTNYFIDSINGSAANNGTTDSTPFAHPDSLPASFSAGDTVTFEANTGPYVMTSAWTRTGSGTQANPIVFEGNNVEITGGLDIKAGVADGTYQWNLASGQTDIYYLSTGGSSTLSPNISEFKVAVLNGRYRSITSQTDANKMAGQTTNKLTDLNNATFELDNVAYVTVQDQGNFSDNLTFSTIYIKISTAGQQNNATLTIAQQDSLIGNASSVTGFYNLNNFVFSNYNDAAVICDKGWNLSSCVFKYGNTCAVRVDGDTTSPSTDVASLSSCVGLFTGGYFFEIDTASTTNQKVDLIVDKCISIKSALFAGISELNNTSGTTYTLTNNTCYLTSLGVLDTANSTRTAD